MTAAAEPSGVVAASAALQERLGKFADLADHEAVLAPKALVLARTVLVAACSPGLETAHMAALVQQVAWLRWFRCDALTNGPDPDRQRADAEREAALRLFTLLHWMQPELVPASMAAVVGALAQAGLSRTPAERVAELADVLLSLARSTSDPDGIAQSVTLYRSALEPSGELGDRGSVLFNLSQALQERYELSQDLSVLEEAITAVRAAEHEFRPGDARRAAVLQNLGGMLEIRFERTTDLSSLEESLQARRQAVEASEPADLGHPARLTGLSIALRMRYEQAGDLDDLGESVVVARQAVASATALNAPAASAESMLALALSARYQANGLPDDLDEAIGLHRAAAHHAVPGCHERLTSLHNLGTDLWRRFRRSGGLRDLEDSIAATRAALAESAEGRQGPYLSGLAVVLLDKYGQTGSLTDINEAVQAAQDAGADRGIRQAERLSNLGLALRIRFERTGDLADIDDAVEAGRAAVAAASNTRELGRHLTNLSSSLQLRFTRTVNTSDLDAAAEAGRNAGAACPPGHPDRPGALSVLSLALSMQAKVHGWPGLRKGQPVNPDEVVTAAREAVAATPAGDVALPDRLGNLAEALSLRFDQRGDVADADNAIEAARAALLGLPRDHPARANHLGSLGRSIRNKSGASQGPVADLGMLARAFAAWREGCDMRTAPARVRFSCALRWMEAARDAGLAPDAEDAHAAAVGILPLLAWRGLDRVTQEEQLAVWRNLATDAAAWALNAGHREHAIELLEAGRTVLWSQLLQLRGEIDDLRAADPRIAERLDWIRASLDGGTELPGGDGASASPADRRMHAASEWDDLLAEIRTRPGFESFLTVPSFARLSAAAAAGPVIVINVSQYRCDALAVTSTGVLAVPLPELTLADAELHEAGLRKALSQSGPGSATVVQGALEVTLPWLWRTVAAPVLRELNLLRTPERDRRDPVPLPRIWWCPTGPLIHLPLHAAAPSPAAPGTIDYVVSSYTPTLRTLLRGTPTSADLDIDRQPQRLLLVTMPETPALPGHGRLDGTEPEAKSVNRSFHGELSRYDGPDAVTGLVAAAMADHHHAHFACHGTIDPERPAQSGLWLYDGVLTISALSRLKLPSSGLAFLSACDTAAGSIEHPDEAITMAAAMHMVGFEQVIGTLWHISDSISPDVADRVYSALSTEDGRLALESTAGTLHAVARNLRDRGFPAALWAPYVHSGP